MDKVKSLASFLDPPKDNPRLMKYPYTLGAQIRLFPYGYYFKHSWLFRYWFYGILASAPIFAWITSKVNTPENKRKWDEIRRKELLETHYIHDYGDGAHGKH